MTFDAPRQLLDDAAIARVFPAAAAEVGCRDGALWRHATGALTYDAGASVCGLDTIFDLASLTKVLATTTRAMQLVAEGRWTLDTPVAEWSPHWRGRDREDVTIRDLLSHSSGLPAHVDLFARARGETEFEDAIGACPLAYAPRSQAVYSDLDFMLLGFLIERIAGASLDAQLERIAAQLDPLMTYAPPASLRDRIAPTEFDARRGVVVCGEVHDENAAALGGVAGHAGVFGTVDAVGSFARAVLAAVREDSWLGPSALVHEFLRKTTVPGSSRALGWDTMLPTSSCGTLMSPTAVGHTGFTGTSLWIDWERDLYVVLLTNRVHPTRANDALLAFRPRFHDAVMRTLMA